MSTGTTRLMGKVKSWPSWMVMGLVVVVLLTVGATRDNGPLTQSDRIDAISRRVACPTCDGESVYVSRASAAESIRNQIARDVAAGRLTDDEIIANIAASFQAAVVDVLCAKTLRAATQSGARGVVLGGGVAANSLLRSEMQRRGSEAGVRVSLPSRAMCTDNAAMIAAAAWHRLRSDGPMDLDCGAYPNLKLSEVPRGESR